MDDHGGWKGKNGSRVLRTVGAVATERGERLFPDQKTWSNLT